MRSAPPIQPTGGPRNPPPHQQGPITVTEDHTAELQSALDTLASIEVLVGIPSKEDQPHFDETGGQAGPTERRREEGGGGIQENAVLGYIHEHGSPINNIPPRPWLGPGVELSKDKWIAYLRQAAEAAFAGDKGRMERALHAAGTTAVSAVKNRITDGIDPPLSQRTIDARRRRTPSRQARTEQDVTPLVDTAQMLNSISYVIKRE